MAVKTEKEGEVEAQIDHFLLSVKRSKFRNEPKPSIHVAREAAEILRAVVTHTGRTNIDGLLKTVRQKGKRLSEASPFRVIIENVARRVMYIIREEYEQIIVDFEAAEDKVPFSAPSTPSVGPAPAAPIHLPTLDALVLPPAGLEGAEHPHVHVEGYVPSAPIAIALREGSDASGSQAGTPDGALGNGSPLRKTISALNPVLTGMLEPIPVMHEFFTKDAPRTQEILWTKGKWKAGVITHISEYISEIKKTTELISNQANEHLYENDVVLTLGYSTIVESFAKGAAEAYTKSKRGKCFEVIVAEGSPECGGHLMAKNLAAAGIRTTVIPDSAIYAMMPRVNKVLLGAYAVLADGGIIAQAGTHMLALAAKAHRAPVVVLAGLYKLSPVFPVNPKAFTVLSSPAAVLPHQPAYRTNLIAQQRADAGVNHLHVRNPQCDYVPPHLIHTYVTDNGALNPSYIYRFLAELYNPEDYEL
eukprot:EG_transcript_8938